MDCREFENESPIVRDVLKQLKLNDVNMFTSEVLSAFKAIAEMKDFRFTQLNILTPLLGISIINDIVNTTKNKEINQRRFIIYLDYIAGKLGVSHIKLRNKVFSLLNTVYTFGSVQTDVYNIKAITLDKANVENCTIIPSEFMLKKIQQIQMDEILSAPKQELRGIDLSHDIKAYDFRGNPTLVYANALININKTIQMIGRGAGISIKIPNISKI